MKLQREKHENKSDNEEIIKNRENLFKKSFSNIGNANDMYDTCDQNDTKKYGFLKKEKLDIRKMIRIVESIVHELEEIEEYSYKQPELNTYLSLCYGYFHGLDYEYIIEIYQRYVFKIILRQDYNRIELKKLRKKLKNREMNFENLNYLAGMLYKFEEQNYKPIDIDEPRVFSEIYDYPERENLNKIDTDIKSIKRSITKLSDENKRINDLYNRSIHDLNRYNINDEQKVQKMLSEDNQEAIQFRIGIFNTGVKSKFLDFQKSNIKTDLIQKLNKIKVSQLKVYKSEIINSLIELYEAEYDLQNMILESKTDNIENGRKKN
ncbi:hypothetical protein GVAV_001912 [Gurleya vavrai]